MEELFEIGEKVLNGELPLEALEGYPEVLGEREEFEAPLRRSALMVSADRLKHLKKAFMREADVINFNLEDGVSEKNKEFARLFLRKFLVNSDLKSDKEVVIRVNPIDSPFFYQDLTYLLPVLPHAFRLSKVKTPEDIAALDKLLTSFEKSRGIEEGFIKIHLSIETPEALNSLNSILKASERVKAAYLGILDLFASLGLPQSKEAGALGNYIREKFVFECRSLGVHPIAPAYQNYQDLDGFKEEALKEKELGFKGKMCISVKQVEVANEVFSPLPEEVERAKKIVKLYQEAERKGKGGITYQGEFIDQPIYKGALSLLRQVGLNESF